MLLKGQRIGQYRILDFLKRGGMSEVYLAIDEHLYRQVAIKVIWTDTSQYDDPHKAQEAIKLFLREAKILAKFDHQSILPVFGSGEGIFQGTTFMYLVMPYRHEGSLSDWLYHYKQSGQPSLSIWDTEHILQQAASALQYAHELNVVHLDIKTSNFLVHGKSQYPSQLNIQLADFGIAKYMNTTGKTQEIRGTPRYMAPEQWENYYQPLPATDQYALAVMIYELLTGQPPFTGNSKEELWHQHNHTQPALPSTLNPRVPRSLDSVILKALAKRPQDRFASVADFANAFRRVLLASSQTSHINQANQTSHGSYTRRSYNTVAEPTAIARKSTIDKTIPIRSPSRPPIPPSNPRHRPPWGKIIGFALLFIVLLAATSGLMYFQFWANRQSPTLSTPAHPSATDANTNNTSTQIDQTGTANANATNIAQLTETSSALTANANASATQSVFATQTAQVNATNIANTQIANANATSAAYTATVAGSGSTVSLNDPLQNQNNNWDTTSFPDGSGCNFSSKAYHVTVGQNVQIQTCYNTNITNFSNFSYQVTMKIIKGSQGGIIFRANKDSGSYYYFYITTGGTYTLNTYTADAPKSQQPLATGTNSAIHPRSDGTYLLAVIALQSTFTLFVNETPVANVVDHLNTYSQGAIGFAVQDITSGSSADVAYTNVVIWQR